jgi:hypothetical protein
MKKNIFSSANQLFQLNRKFRLATLAISMVLLAFFSMQSSQPSLIVQVFGQTASSSASNQQQTNSQESSEGQKVQEDDLSITTRNLRERIERIVEEKRDQIKGVISDLDSQRRATIGEILRVTDDTLSIKTKSGTEIIPLSNTRYSISILKDGETTALEEIAVGNWLLALGLIEDGSFQPIRLIVSEDSLRPRTRSVDIGTVAKISRSSIEIEPRNSESTVTYTINSKTEFYDLLGETIELQDIEESVQVIIAGIFTSNNSNNNTNDQNQTENDSSSKLALKIKVLTTINQE